MRLNSRFLKKFECKEHVWRIPLLHANVLAFCLGSFSSSFLKDFDQKSAIEQRFVSGKERHEGIRLVKLNGTKDGVECQIKRNQKLNEELKPSLPSDLALWIPEKQSSSILTKTQTFIDSYWRFLNALGLHFKDTHPTLALEYFDEGSESSPICAFNAGLLCYLKGSIKKAIAYFNNAAYHGHFGALVMLSRLGNVEIKALLLQGY